MSCCYIKALELRRLSQKRKSVRRIGPKSREESNHIDILQSREKADGTLHHDINGFKGISLLIAGKLSGCTDDHSAVFRLLDGKGSTQSEYSLILDPVRPEFNDVISCTLNCCLHKEANRLSDRKLSLTGLDRQFQACQLTDFSCPGAGCIYDHIAVVIALIGMHAFHLTILDDKARHICFCLNDSALFFSCSCISHCQIQRIDLAAGRAIEGSRNILCQLRLQAAGLFRRDHMNIDSAFSLSCRDLIQKIILQLILCRLQTSCRKVKFDLVSKLLLHVIEHLNGLYGQIQLGTRLLGMITDNTVCCTG